MIRLIGANERLIAEFGETQISYRRLSSTERVQMRAAATRNGVVDAEELSRIVLARCVLGWSGIEGDPAFTPENVALLPILVQTRLVDLIYGGDDLKNS